jgi:clan AA aspartic protease (TIGR02281 family)
MRLYRKMAIPVTALLLMTALPPLLPAHTSAPPLVREEVDRAQTDFATGGSGRLRANWNACVERARANQDANAAERCIVYGYGALLLDDSNPSENRWPASRALTPENVAPAQIEMMEIMGIPPGPRQAWLDRYRRWASEDRSGPETHDAGRGHGFSDIVTRDAPADLARAADGQYPREALRRPEIAQALRHLVGPELFARLKDYTFGAPMEFTGQFTVGAACVPRGCGTSEARYVFSSEDAWLGILDGKHLRLYGNPPRQARALLLKGTNQTAWRGPVEDVGHASVGRETVGRETLGHVDGGRQTVGPIGPAPIVPISADPIQRIQPGSDETEVRLRRQGGTLTVPVSINNTMTLPFMIDSGASDVGISADVLEKLMRTGTVTKADFLGRQSYHLADGSTVSGETFRIHTLKVGDREVRDVIGSVSNDENTLLLGQSFLSRFRSWSIDNQRQVLLLK